MGIEIDLPQPKRLPPPKSVDAVIGKPLKLEKTPATCRRTSPPRRQPTAPTTRHSSNSTLRGRIRKQR